eukprot:13376502-Ditylum_brightwellii.AAC.1
MSCNTRDTIVAHKYAQQYKFKGSWDAAGKIAKKCINQLELHNEQIANANDCYLELGIELKNNGNEEDNVRLMQYGQIGDMRVLENTTLREQLTFVGSD